MVGKGDGRREGRGEKYSWGEQATFPSQVQVVQVAFFDDK